MKPWLIATLLISVLIPLTSGAQTTVLFDTFEDRDLTVNPTWSGDIDDFSFMTDTIGELTTTLLRLDAAPDPTRTQISIPSTTTTGEWEFFVRQDFNPSNFNRAFIFLMADRENLNYLDGSEVSGYALRTGDNDSPRRFRLVRFDAGNQTELIVSDTVIEEGAGYSVRVTRNDDGTWRLFVASGYTSIPVLEGTPAKDQTYIESSHFGILLRYSSGNVNNFYFDDIRIQNSAPFRLDSAYVVSATDIELQFSYPIDTATLQVNDFTVSNLGSPLQAKIGSSQTRVLLTFPDIIPDGDYSVQVRDLKNIFGSELAQPSETSFSFVNPFTLISADVTSSRTIDLLFSLPPDGDLTLPSDFTVNQNLAPSAIKIDSSRAELQFGSDLPPGELIVRMNGIKSGEGWRIPDGITISTYRFGDASAGDIVINEFLYRRTPPDDAQFVELFNTTQATYNLGGWLLVTDRGSAEIPSGTILEPSAYMLLADKPLSVGDGGTTSELPGFEPLRTTGDAIILKTSESVTIDSLTYEPDWGGNESGISLERKDPLAISIDPVNWASSDAPSGSTPLRENSRFQRDVLPPALLFAKRLPESPAILIRFDEFIDPGNFPDITLNNRTVPVTGVNGRIGNELIVNSGDIDLKSGSEILLEVNQAADHQGNLSGMMEIPVAQPVAPGDIVVNEIMFDPLDDDFDQMPNQSDYIELINRRPYAISLEGMLLHDTPDENNEVREMAPRSSRSRWIPAKGFALIYPDIGQTGIDSSRIGKFFNLSSTLWSHSLQIERTTLSLPLSGREIYLADSLGSVIDMVHYSEEWHNPNLIDTKGIALERINPNGETADASNWGSSTVPAGGTPGKQNSLYQTPKPAADGNTLRLEPNPFSPDDDGHEDHLFISYSFNDPNYMLRVRIFDRHGRLVHTLADSHHAGFEGALTWNGRNSDGVTGRIGIYIVHVEAFNSSTGDKKQFREVAVLARRF